MVQRMNRASPSRHCPDWRSNVRGVEATVKLATACPVGVKRSSGHRETALRRPQAHRREIAEIFGFSRSTVHRALAQ